MKKFLAVLMTAVLLLCMVGCSEKGKAEEKSDDGNKGGGGEKIVLGVTLHDLSSDGYSANLIGIKEMADELGNVEIRAVSAEGSAEDQVSQVEDFITSGVDGIIILPVDSTALSGAVGNAAEAKIPVVSMDRTVSGDVASATIESDNYEHGKVAADLMLAAAKKQGMDAGDLKVLELLGAQASSSGVERHEGFSERCKELGITIVSSLPTEWEADEAYNSVLDGFQANADINAIFEASDIAMHSVSARQETATPRAHSLPEGL